MIHSAALLLERAGLIDYERKSGSFLSTPLGKISSYYYIKHPSMITYNDNMKPYMNIIDLFRVFSLSDEFKLVPVRENEKLELQKFIDRVPVPVKGTLDDPATKINVLLQSYISNYELQGYDLNSDMVYVTQSANRIA